MAILAAYLDDSGTHKGSPLVSVAGAVGSVSQWIKFSRRWRRQLRQWNLEFFRMADFVSSRGPYEGWDEPRKHHVLSRLVQTIKDYARFLVGNAVYSRDFDEAFAKYPNSCIKDAYHFCAVLTLPAVGYWKMESKRREPVALIFESGNKLLDQYFRLVQRDFLDDRAREAYGIGSVTVGDKKEMPPLQAADIIAYGTYKCKAQKAIEPYLENSYRSLFEIRNSGFIWNREGIEQILSRVSRDLEARPHLYRQMFKKLE